MAERLIHVMRAVGMPNGLGDVGYSNDDAATLMDGTWHQQRLLTNAPVDVDKDLLVKVFQDAVRYW